jgi:Spy/CpxP family protein refolding chaperone
MSKTAALISALALAITVSSAPAHADAYKLDAKGGCHDASGKYAKKEMCKAPMAYKLDAKGKCHDAKGKFAKQELCKK